MIPAPVVVPTRPPRPGDRSPTSRARTTPTPSGRCWTSGTPPTRTRRSRSRSSPTRPTSSTTTCAALPGQGRRVRRRQRRRGLDRGVRGQGVAAPAQGQLRARHRPAAARDREDRHLQQHPLRRAGDQRRRHALLPQGPRPDPAQDLGRDDGDVLDRQREQHGLLRRPVLQVRGPDGERGRGDQHRRRGDRGRGRQDARGQHPGGCGRPGQAGRRLQERQHPQAGDHLHRGGGPPVVPGGQAAVPAPVAVRVQPGLVRGRLQGEGQVRRGATAGDVRGRARPASVATTPPSAPTPTTRPPRWTS